VIDRGIRFTQVTRPVRVVFGPGTVAGLPAEVAALNLNRVVVVTTPRQRPDAERIAELLGDTAVGVYAQAAMHVPVAVAENAVAYVREAGADGCVAVGGGSAIGLGKAIALRTGLPIVAVPTTYAGSEMTPIWGLTDEAGKTTGRDERVRPVTVVYDPDLSRDLSVEMSVTSAVNALAHAVEATYAPDGSPVIDLMAADAVRTLWTAIGTVAADPADADARAQLLYGAWLAGACLGATTMSLHHKLCHIVGGTFNLHHAWTHTVILPYVMTFNLRPGTRPYDLIGAALGQADPGRALYDRLAALGYHRSLAELGLPTTAVETVVRQATESAYANPRRVSPADIRDLVSAAQEGTRP
jgi:maleylacetate reductase